MDMYEMAANTIGVTKNKLPKCLERILNEVNFNIKSANFFFEGKELRSSQVVALIVYLWKLGIIK